MAEMHANNLRHSGVGKLEALAADEISERVNELASEQGARVIEADEMIGGGDLEAVVIATPTDTHAGLACRAIDAGLDVFCEKPLARTVEEALRIAAAAAKKKAKVAVGHVVRYFPEYRSVKELIDAGALGRPSMARLARFNGSPAFVREWYGEAERSGGALVDMAIHDIDWCLWALGPASRVYARRAGDIGRELASVTLRHRNGAISYIDVSWRNAGFSTSLEVCGTEAVYRVEGSSAAGLVVEQDTSSSCLVPGLALAGTVTDDPYRLELEAALGWFAGGKPPLAILDDGLDALRVAAAAEQSAGLGRPVELTGGPA